MHDRTLHAETDLLPCPGCGRGSYHPEAVEHGGVGSWCPRCDGYVNELAAEGSNEPHIEPPKPSPDADLVQVIFPWDCLVSVNRRSGGMVGWTTREYREARDAMAARVAEKMRDGESLHGPVKVMLNFHPPDRRKRDCHNLTKAIFDALQGPEGIRGVYEDDSQVVEWSGRVHAPWKDGARVVVLVERVRAEEEATRE